MRKRSTDQRAVTGALILLAIIISFCIYGCSETSSPTTGTSPTKSTIKTTTGINNSTVTSIAHGKSSNINDFHPTVDSIVITRARVVVSALQLHQVNESDADTIIIILKDDKDDGKGNGKKHHEDDDWTAGDEDVINIIDRDDGTIRVGPFLAEFDASGTKVISQVTIPPGTYDRMKFEIHKLNEEDEPTLLNDPIFGDFVNGGRYTFIIDGFVYVGGVAYPFSYKSAMTENVNLKIQPPVTFSTNHIYTLQLTFDPKVIFMGDGTKPLDPREEDNDELIEASLNNSIALIMK